MDNFLSKWTIFPSFWLVITSKTNIFCSNQNFQPKTTKFPLPHHQILLHLKKSYLNSTWSNTNTSWIINIVMCFMCLTQFELKSYSIARFESIFASPLWPFFIDKTIDAGKSWCSFTFGNFKSFFIYFVGFTLDL